MYASICLALFPLFFSAPSVFATPGLSLKVSGSDNACGVDHLKVIVTLANTGDETLKLFNEPHSALHKSPTNTFAITHESGRRPVFHGIPAEMTPPAEADEEAFTVLEPGESVDISHDLTAAYDFTDSGEGSYSVEVYNLLHYIGLSNNEPIPILAAGESLSIVLSEKLSKARISSGLVHNFPNCNAIQRRRLTTAARASLALVNAALRYLNRIGTGGQPGPLYEWWFGEYQDVRYNRVKRTYERMRIALTLNCRPPRPTVWNGNCCANDRGNRRFGCVNPNQRVDNQPIYICPSFWDLSTGNTDHESDTVLSQASALVHEASHLRVVESTIDDSYGVEECRGLSLTPDTAITNADTYRLFSECVKAENLGNCYSRCRDGCPLPTT